MRTIRSASALTFAPRFFAVEWTGWPMMGHSVLDMLKHLSLGIWLVAILFAQAIYGQGPGKVTLKFSLELEPTASELGLDDPDAIWKLFYKIRIADTVNLERSKSSGKLVKSIVKAKTVEKGKLRRKSLAFSENRIILRDVIFDTKILDRFRSNISQTFLIELKWKLCSKTLKKRLKDIGNKHDCATMHSRFDLPADSIRFLPNGTFGVRMGISDEFGTFTFVTN